MDLRELRNEDWAAVKEIYEQGIAGRQATFETEAPDWPQWDRSHLEGHRLVALEDGRVVGWAALAPVSERCCYEGVAENSVYVDSARHGHGSGKGLLERLVGDAEQSGIWTVQTGVFPENAASVGLHLACGFRVVGLRERLAKLDGAWRDVLFLERRSEVIA